MLCTLTNFERSFNFCWLARYSRLGFGHYIIAFSLQLTFLCTDTCLDLSHTIVELVTKMKLKDIQSLELPASADMHVHLRQAELMELTVPQILKGGVDTVFVMVLIQPPVSRFANVS